MDKTPLYFTQVVATPAGDAFLAGHVAAQGHDPTFTRFAKAGDAGWLHLGDLGAVVYATTAVPDAGGGRPAVAALGRDGPLRLFKPGQKPRDIKVPLRDRSVYFEAMCSTGAGLCVCGGQRQVMLWDGKDWSPIDQGLFQPFDGKNDFSLYAVSELSDGSLLVAGSHGFVASRSKAGLWTTHDVGTNLGLHSIAPRPDGGAWIGGDGGILLMADNGLRTWIDCSDPTLSRQTFDSMAVLGGLLYIAAFDRVLVTAHGQPLATVAGLPSSNVEFHCLSAAGDFLWVTGDENVHRLGPGGWQKFVPPDNT